jgi:hypothetical protein
MKKRVFGTAAAALALAMTSCGNFSADGKLYVSDPIVKTEYRISSTGAFVGCDQVDGADAITTVKAVLTSTGVLKRLDVQLKGQTTSKYDDNFKGSFSLAQATLDQNKNQVTVKFTANAATGILLPTAVHSGFTSLGIVPVPIDTSNFIKEVSVSSQDLAGPAGSGFRVQVQGYSENDSPTAVLNNLETISVYTKCKVVKTTTEKL